MIEARALSKRYGGVPAVDGVTFTLPEGSRTALIGPNGSGKSTLLALLSTLLFPTSGDVRIDGLTAAEAPQEMRRRIGVLAHRPMLYEELSPLENLVFFAKLYDVPEPRPRVEELLRAVGLWHRRDEPTAVLSRGYHQRLALARALVHRPRVLLLDEPETGLDEGGIDLLDELMLGAAGVTVLAATHRHDRIDAWADGVLALDRGRLVQPPARGAVEPPLRAVR